MNSLFITGVRVSPPPYMTQILEGFTKSLPHGSQIIEHFSIIENGFVYYYFRTLVNCYMSKAEYKLCKKISKTQYENYLSIYKTRLNQSQAQGLMKYTQMEFDF